MLKRKRNYLSENVWDLENIDYGNINKTNRDNETYLHYAVKSKDVQLVEKLLRRGATESITIQNNFDGNTPFHLACMLGALEIVKLLLKNGAKKIINLGNLYGNTPLHLAINSYDNSFEISELLLKNGAYKSINKKNRKFFTPLSYAVLSADISRVKLLAKYTDELHLDVVDKDMGKTPLMLALDKSNEILKFLIPYSNVEVLNIRSKNGTTVLEQAVKRKKYDIIEALLKHGGDKIITSESVLRGDKKVWSIIIEYLPKSFWNSFYMFEEIISKGFLEVVKEYLGINKNKKILIVTNDSVMNNLISTLEDVKIYQRKQKNGRLFRAIIFKNKMSKYGDSFLDNGTGTDGSYIIRGIAGTSEIKNENILISLFSDISDEFKNSSSSKKSAIVKKFL